MVYLMFIFDTLNNLKIVDYQPFDRCVFDHDYEDNLFKFTEKWANEEFR